MSTKIGVIESRWHDAANGIKKNTTVKPLFDFLSDLHFGSHHAYDYEMVGTQGAFVSALERISRSRATTVAYLAMHGSDTGLHLHGGDRISRTILKNILLRITRENGSNLTGLYFGSCLFGSRALADYLFKNDAPVTWIAGYQESVDFVASSGLDLLFFNTLMAVRQDAPTLTKRQQIGEVARRIRQQMQGLCNSPLENGDANLGLGFSIYVKMRGRTQGAKDLLRDY
ncbi:hypothetical protein [Gemmobacter nanjingensis]|uniref:hypothetical protein n=1 Tax=Gemmobacter nanjingensis TaxID=488454 RepID=UPI0016784F6D|nr:hypothetical protein [Gemmobacter nanjingensis]